ncbi:MAG: hypothetical protein Q8R78_05310 [Candidatus Omnitrophota bacterium]|nr:hypothetical protein [Candidatus Omnitrophota bacterium]
MNGYLRPILFGTLCVLCLSASVWALEREVKVELHHAPSTPVDIKESQVRLVEVFASPVQGALLEDPTAWTSVEYANRRGRTPSKLLLKGDTVLLNRSPHTIEVIALTVMPMDAFRQGFESIGQGPYKIHQVEEWLPSRTSKRVSWEQICGSADVYSVAILVTAVRFSDGSVWTAPREAVQSIFFPSPKR